MYSYEEIDKIETEERRKIVNDFNLKRSQEMPNDNPEEKKKREVLFNEKKIEYENNYHDDTGERYELCYTFEDHENQIKFFEYTFKLYIFADYINRAIIDSEDEVGNEGFFDTEKVLRFISSHFDKDFEEVLQYYKDKFSYRE